MEVEGYEAKKSLGSDKSPGPNGFPYQKIWVFMKLEIMGMILEPKDRAYFNWSTMFVWSLQKRKDINK